MAQSHVQRQAGEPASGEYVECLDVAAIRDYCGRPSDDVDSKLTGWEVGALVAHQDVVIAVLGTSATLTGFVLVFLGIIISTIQASATDEGLKSLLKAWSTPIAVMILAPFFLGLICVWQSLMWLTTGIDHEGFYRAIVGTFIAQLVLLALVASAVTFATLDSTADADND
jgi:hydrogenase maturation factor